MIRKHTAFLSFAALSFFLFFTAINVAAMPGVSASSESSEARVISGTVTETMNASGYTYMLVQSGPQEIWVAIPETTVEQGAEVNFFDGMIMENFTSKSLQRTFKTIVFSPGLAVKSQEKAVSPHGTSANPDDSFAAAVKAEKMGSGSAKPADIGGATSSGGSMGAIVPFKELSVEKAAAENGYTIEEIFAKPEELHGKKVQIRGKVVKYSPLIMGRNWVHLQDGTGDPMQNSHDLVVTTTEEVEVNSVVTLEGTLAANKDFGAGYKYVVIVEEATTVK